MAPHFCLEPMSPGSSERRLHCENTDLRRTSSERLVADPKQLPLKPHWRAGWAGKLPLKPHWRTGRAGKLEIQCPGHKADLALHEEALHKAVLPPPEGAILPQEVLSYPRG